MTFKLKRYTAVKNSLKEKLAEKKETEAVLKKFEQEFQDDHKPVEFSDVVQVATKVVIGGGIGLLAGVAAIAVAASAVEIIVAGAVVKVAGVVGGAVGLSLGMNKFKKRRDDRTGELDRPENDPGT